MAKLISSLLPLFFILGMIFVVMSAFPGGLSQRTISNYQNVVERTNQAQNTQAAARAALAATMQQHAKVFAPLKAQWEQQIAEVDKHLQTYQDAAKQAQTIYQDNDPDQEEQLNTLLADMTREVNAAQTILQPLLTKSKDVENLIANSPQRMEELRTNVSAMAAENTSSLRQDMRQAMLDWPAQSKVIHPRLKELETLPSQAQQYLAQAETHYSEKDYLKLTQVAGNISEAVQQFTSLQRVMPKRLQELYVSWEVILEDLEIREGAEVRFRQKLKRITVRSTTDSETPSEDLFETTSEGWKSIDRTTYERHKNYIGMSLYRKPAGKFAHEQETLVQPPGYNYIASQEQGRNQYGYWNNSGGGSFWVWYGQYRLMSDLFWGPSYGRIGANDYRQYRRSADSGRTYYGRDARGSSRYGSNGSVTRSKYSSSKYVKTGGFRNSQYTKSGGTFRGTRYTSSSSYRSSSFGGGSRSLGGK